MHGENLADALVRLDRKQYGAYRDLRRRRYDVEPFWYEFLHIQGDPFAAPSRLRVAADPAVVDLPSWSFANPDARRATADYLHRGIRRALAGVRRGPGSGKSGRLDIDGLGQEVLSRTAVSYDARGGLVLSLTVGLPAQGRRILGRAAADLLTRTLPDALEDALDAVDLDALRRWVETVEDQVALRAGLEAQGLVAFLADGACLPRRTGVDDRPLADGVPFQAPAPLAVTLEAPHAGPLRGLGIPAGVTLIVGGGYHGKSTVLDALARGVYDHVLGDGRHQCVTVFEAVSVRAEDGRAVTGVDLRPFIDGLPLGRDTAAFVTEDASGSTSQAAAIVEAMEVGARVLLIDEDTAATNFMIRDARMRRLVPDDREPITPFLHRVRQLHETHGVSTILVVGGAGDYLDVADTVIRMDAYLPKDATAEAQAVVAALPLGDGAPTAPGPWPSAAPRVPDPRALDPRVGRKGNKVRAHRTRTIQFGEDEIDVALLAQLVDPAQARFIGDVLLALATELCDGQRTLAALLDMVDFRVREQGLEALAARGFGDRALARRFEIAAALNRLRSLGLR